MTIRSPLASGAGTVKTGETKRRVEHTFSARQHRDSQSRNITVPCTLLARKAAKMGKRRRVRGAKKRKPIAPVASLSKGTKIKGKNDAGIKQFNEAFQSNPQAFRFLDPESYGLRAGLHGRLASAKKLGRGLATSRLELGSMPDGATAPAMYAVDRKGDTAMLLLQKVRANSTMRLNCCRC